MSSLDCKTRSTHRLDCSYIVAIHCRDTRHYLLYCMEPVIHRIIQYTVKSVNRACAVDMSRGRFFLLNSDTVRVVALPQSKC